MTVLWGAANAEVGGALPNVTDLGSYSGVGRLQPGIVQLRVVQPDRLDKFRLARFLEAIVDTPDPLHVRAKARVAAEIQCHMYTESGRAGQWIHQMAERRAASQ